MKKGKILIYSVVLLLLVACVGLGAFSLVIKDSYSNNKITFEVNNNGAYCKVSGKYYYNGAEQTDKNYDPTAYTQSSDLQPEKFEGFPVWNIGESMFDVEYEGASPETLTYEITIENLNSEKALTITLSDVAVGEKQKEQETLMCFYTKITYQLSNEEAEVQFNNKTGEEVNIGYYTSGQKSVDVSAIKEIPVASSITITIELERKTKTEEFTFLNNFKVNIDTVNTQN